MWTRLLFWLLFVVRAKSLLVIPDEKQCKTETAEETVKSSDKHVETLKQLVNQETNIRISLEMKVYDLLRDVTDLKMKMKSTIKQLQEEVCALRHENSLMRTDYEDQSNVTTLHSGKLLELTSAVSTLEAFSKNISSPSRSAESSETVAFTATVTQTKTSQSGQTFVFPHVITNIGGGYNESSGVFTAPRDGVYVFFCKITGSTNLRDMYFEFSLNGSAKTRNLLWGRSANPYRTSSNSIVLQLSHGDRVWVQMYDGGKHYSWGAGGDQSFSGYLL